MARGPGFVGDVTFVVPTLNESASLPRLLAALAEAAPGARVLIADDDSSDGTRSVAASFAGPLDVEVLHRSGPDKGLSASVADAILRVKTQNFVVMDADLQHPPEAAVALLSGLDDADLVVGRRANYDSLGARRTLVSRSARALARAHLRARGKPLVDDPMSGLFAARTDFAQSIVRAHGHAFERAGFKILLDLLRFAPEGARVAESPYSFAPRAAGASKLRARHVVSLLRQLGAPGRLAGGALATALQPAFWKFLAVGASGVAVNQGALLLLAGALPLLVASLFAVEASILWNFALNDVWSFRDRSPSASRATRLARYHAHAWTGGALNVLLLALLVFLAGADPLLANVVGIAVAAAWNWALASSWTWGDERVGFAGAMRRALARRSTRYAIALAIQVAIAPFLVHDWDGYVFIETARDFAQGTTPYAMVEDAPSKVFVGDGVPAVNGWYAYPPVPLLLFTPPIALATAATSAPWAARLALKVPFILGHLALAGLAFALVRDRLRERGVADAEAESRARSAELFILFNPFLVFIAAAWGMFDGLTMAFLVGALLALVKRKPALAGVAFALACLVKPFPAFAGPFVLALAWRLSGTRGAVRFLGAGVATGALVVLPFLLDAPRGFLQQVLLNHVQRPPQGFSLVSLPVAFPWLNEKLGLALPEHVAPEAMSRASFFLLLALLAVLWPRAFRVRDVEGALHLTIVALAAVLLTSKVVNEQYFVMPLALAIVAFGLTSERVYRLGAHALTWGALVSALLLGWHFITFVPPDVALRAFPFHPDEALPRVVRVLGWSDEQAAVLPVALGILALVPALAVAFRVLLPETGRPARFLARRLRFAPRATGPVAALSVALLFIAPMGVGFLTASADEPALPPGGASPDRLAGAIYYSWWVNPSHDPAYRYGNWAAGTVDTPVDGFYTSTSGQHELEFRSMRENGIDLVVWSYHAYEAHKLPGLTRAAFETGLLGAPLVELVGVMNDARYRPAAADGSLRDGYALRSDVAAAIVATAAPAVAAQIESPAAWRIGGKPVVLVSDFGALDLDASADSAARLARAVGELAPADRPAGAVPSSYEEMAGATPEAAKWRRAFALARDAFWGEARASLEARFGPLYLVAVSPWRADGTLRDGASGALASRAWDQVVVAPPDERAARDDAWLASQAIAAQASRARGLPVFAGVTPRLGGEAPSLASLERAWDEALAESPDVVLTYSWNNFFDGSDVAPTIEHARARLEATARGAARLEALPREEPPRVLLLASFVGSALERGAIDPDWTHALARDLALAARGAWGARVALADWNEALDGLDLLRYDLVIVEPGAGPARSPHAREHADALLARLAAGAPVVALGSAEAAAVVPFPAWAAGSPIMENATVDLAGRAVPLPPSDRTRVHEPAGGIAPYLELANATARAPGAWIVEVEAGRAAVTAFRPQVAMPAATEGARLLAAVAAPFLAVSAA